MAAQREWLEKDYYAVLGVPRDAPQADIKKAYRKLAQELHPDANKDPSAEQRFKEVNEAYGVVGNETKRKEYDELRRLAAAGGPGFGAFGGAGGPGGPGGFTFHEGDLDDLLGSLFGAGGGQGGFTRAGRPRAPRRGGDLQADVHLSFEDALHGVRTKLRVTGDGACDTCKGSGARPGTAPSVCGNCGGSGHIAIDQGPFSLSQPCPRCAGRGQVIEHPCATCDGTGRVVKPRELTVKVPAGIRDGATIRVAGRGAPGSNGGPAGDVLVRVHVEPHPVFGRRGDDVTIDLPIAYSEAALGTKLAVPLPDGGTTTIRIPAGTASGRTFRVRGKGAPRSKGGSGDLLVTVKVAVPAKLDRRQRQLLEELAELDDTVAAREELLRQAV